MIFVKSVETEVQETFERLDQDGDGRITFEEFVRVMLEMDHAEGRQALRLIFDAIDTGGEGSVSFAEFHDWVSR